MESRGGHPPGKAAVAQALTAVGEGRLTPGGPALAEAPARGAVPPHAPEGVWRFTAALQDSAVPELRHKVEDLLVRQAGPGRRFDDELLQSVLLIVSELVTNAVRHAALLSPRVGVEIALRGGWVRIGVEDRHPYRPKALAADPDMEHTSGRGLFLVRAVTTEAGGVCDVEPTTDGGKVVWAALPVPRR
ncbi:ATP-binding protein [Streptomyces sulphureus]|uniref:ATP-binding protein n=1 Tax=Streptomyces sulphureus TaxID=47758 RepID=UPI0003783B2D|nr:ATP-binding protein [Streptomyces sulphureus]